MLEMSGSPRVRLAMILIGTFAGAAVGFEVQQRLIAAQRAKMAAELDATQRDKSE